MMSMRAYELERASNCWRLTERDVPRPGRGQVLVRLRAASLNFRDLLVARGAYSFGNRPDGLIPLADGAGEVVEIGDDVSRVRPGDRVANIFFQDWANWIAGGEPESTGEPLGGFIAGVLSEYRVFSEQALVMLPRHLSWEEGATLSCAGLTSWNALFGLQPVRPGQTVLVLGTGGCSIFAAQFAKLAGACVIATSSSSEKLVVAKSLGVDHGINYGDVPAWDDEVKRLTDGRGVHHILEVGGGGTLARSLAAIRPGGVVSLVGNLAGDVPISSHLPLMARCIVRSYAVGTRDMFETMNEAIELSGLRPHIDRIFQFNDAPKALDYLAEARHVGKVVVSISNS